MALLTGIPTMANEARFITAIECVADFPDDQLEDGMQIVRPGGLGVAKEIALLLRKNGAAVTEPALDFEHGWEFFAEWTGRRFWVLVSDMGETMLIQTKDMTFFLKRLFVGRATYDGFLKLLHQSLLEDPRFTSIEWKAL